MRRGEAPIALVERDGNVITTRDHRESSAACPSWWARARRRAAAELVDAVKAHRAISARTAAFARISARRWNLILDDGVIVKLPETDWEKQLAALEHLIIDNGILERDVTEIDLRSPTHYFFMLKNGEKKDVQRGKET
jgi:cell division protein FtsQ